MSHVSSSILKQKNDFSFLFCRNFLFRFCQLEISRDAKGGGARNVFYSIARRIIRINYSTPLGSVTSPFVHPAL